MTQLGTLPRLGRYARNAAESANPELWRGLVGAWVPALGVQGGRLYDLSGYGNHGTLTNMDPAADWVVGDNGWALDLDGTNDHVVVANNPSLKIEGKQITLHANVTPHDAGAYGGSRIISKRTDGGGSDVYSLYTQANNVRFRLDGQDLVSSNTFANNESFDVTGVYNGVDKRIYWNGINDPVAPQPKSDNINASSRAVHLGMREGQSRLYDGIIHLVLVYARALVAEEILQLHLDPLALFRLRPQVPMFVSAPPVGGGYPSAYYDAVHVQSNPGMM